MLGTKLTYLKYYGPNCYMVKRLGIKHVVDPKMKLEIIFIK